MSEAKKGQKGSSNNLNQFNKYLDNNIDVLHEKFLQYFGDPFPFQEVASSDDLQYAIKYIYDVFNFGKYEANPSLNKTLKSSLVTNVKSFVQAYAKEYQTFTAEVAVKLLKYCIENNEMFAVHYDKKKPQKKTTQEAVQKSEPIEPAKSEAKQVVHTQPVQQPVKQEPKEAKHEPKQQPKQEKVDIATDQPPIIQSKQSKEDIKSSQMPEKRSLDQSNIRNQFLSQQLIERAENMQLIKKQLKGVFEFYCKQQQNISPHSTFDNINHKCQTMNLGKFMAFAIASNLIHSKERAYSQGKLDKRTVVAAYKKVAEGDKEIGFTHFLNLMQQLKKVDQEIYTKLGVGMQGMKGKNKLLQKLKYFNLPFNTRDPQGRQIMPYNRAFIPKLTAHSGKHQADLRDQLISRKQRAKHQPSERSKLIGASKIVANEDQTRFNLQLGSSNENIEPQDMSFLSRLIKQDQNDELFLKDYQLPLKKQTNLQVQEKINKSLDKGRYDQIRTGVPYTSKSGALTSRKTKKEDFTLPSIRKKAIQSQSEYQRHSIALPKRFGDKSVLN